MSDNPPRSVEKYVPSGDVFYADPRLNHIEIIAKTMWEHWTLYYPDEASRSYGRENCSTSLARVFVNAAPKFSMLMIVANDGGNGGDDKPTMTTLGAKFTVTVRGIPYAGVVGFRFVTDFSPYYDWLRENRIVYDHSPIAWPEIGGATQTFEFTNLQDATLFKLRWGGL